MTETTEITFDDTPMKATDRCDRCAAQAYVRLQLISGGELLFCGHHYASNVEKLLPIMAFVHDERHVLDAAEAAVHV